MHETRLQEKQLQEKQSQETRSQEERSSVERLQEERLQRGATAGDASTRDAIRWAMNQVRKDAEPVAYEAAVVRQLVEALEGMLRGIFDGPDESDIAMIVSKAKEALAAAKEARL